ncbi:peptidyl-prolyl cis-trans isomerase D [Sphingomonas naasensis]|uniref:Parvulin-like PPIase n=1 Tax=Sphingomonas naasensis TaxID=1344951 RepID=A0A4S1WRH7_9SPHN|nr:peptidylprolyl isomerase [Sphingomonas naasensis]NIJ18739.1 peptidyl-prolyl cis-trans isomerase D [Sphingomonas naasensis]TGX45974.1 peptidylprolyl isomerase [Sphingomonas naasensis]
MLNFFRRFTKSRYGLIAVFIFLGIIALAFVAGDVTGIRMNGTGSGGDVVAKVGSRKITDRDVRDRVDRFIRNLQSEGQTVTMEQFLAQGGLEMTLDEMINSAALVEFAQKSGMQVSKRLIDGEIASNPAFVGLDGKFSQKQFEDLLAQNRIPPALFRASMTDERYNLWLINRATLGNHIPDGVLLPYASLQLERRTGTVGLVPTIAMDPGPDPDDKTLAAWYQSRSARYTVPQRRIVRYAMVKPDQLRAGTAATEAEIADAYKKAGNRFAATEKRNVRQLVALDQATANRIAGEVKGGKTLAAAASAAGLEPTNFEGVEKAALARQTAPAVADAAFAAAQGGVVGPVRSPLGWHVLQVEKIEKIAAKTLDQARAELASEISARKLAQTLADLRQSIEDGIGDSKNFDELVAGAKLTPGRTPALTANAADPENPEFKPEPATTAIMRAGFGIEQPGDDSQIVPIAEDGSFALVGLERIVPAAPRPLAQIRAQVVKDYLVEKALQKARGIAIQVIAKLEKGVPMQQALTEAGVTKGPPPKPFDFKRADVQRQNIAPYLQMAFRMAPGKAKLVEGQNREGYYVVHLAQVEEHSAAGDPVALQQVRGGLAPQVGPELARQFAAAIRNDLKVTRNDKALAQLRADLTRTGSAR